MKTITRYVVKPALAVLVAILSMGVLVATAEAAGKGDTVSVTEYSDWGGDAALAKIAVDTGRALITHLSTAHALLEDGKIAEARTALTTTRSFANTLERIMPDLTIVEDIKGARKRVLAEDVTVLQENLLPIYANLAELQVYAPELAQRVRGKLEQAKKHAAAGNKKRAAKVLSETANDIIKSTVYLPVEYVDEQVHGALYALNQPKPDVALAKAAVDRALGSMTTVIDEAISRTK